MNQIDLKDRVAVVTGGARGIGQSIIKRFLASGAKCALWDRDVDLAKSWVSKLEDPSRVEIMAVELTEPESVASAAKDTKEHFGKIDIAVNNAGIAGVSKMMMTIG